MTAGVTELVQRGPVPIDRFEIGRRRRHLHIIFCRRIESAIAADAKVDAGCLEQGLNLRLDHARRRHWRGGRDVGGQSVALIGVEDGEPLQEWNGLRLFAHLTRSAPFVGWHEAVGIDHGCAALALADMTTERKRLAEGQPALARKAALDHRPPEDENVDAAVGPGRRGVPWHRQRRLCCRRPPGLNPGHAAGLQLGDNLVGDFVIKGGPVLAGARARMSGHRGSFATGAASLSRSSNPSRPNPASPLTLNVCCGSVMSVAGAACRCEILGRAPAFASGMEARMGENPAEGRGFSAADSPVPQGDAPQT